MIVYNIITAICFALLTLSALYVIVNFAIKNRSDRISFIRGFKKGKCIAIFIVAIPLLCIGYIYGGDSVINGILNSLPHVFDFVVLKFSLGKINALIESNLFYRITVYYCCVLVILNATLFALSFIGQYLWQSRNTVAGYCTKKERLLIFGNNENSISIYKSTKDYRAYIVDDISSSAGLELYRKNVNYLSVNNLMVKRILQSAIYKKHTVIINFEDDEKNLQLCNLIIEKAKEIKITPKKIFEELLNKAQEEAAKDGIEWSVEEIEKTLEECRQKARREALFENLRIYVFGDPRYEALYNDIVSSAFGCIRYKNKYQMLAMDFVDKYPLTKFMNGDHIDYKTSLIKSGVDINVCMIGFGKPNRQIFLTSVANNQFVTAGDSGIELKKVNYHIFDKVKAENNKNLNHLYYRYKNEFAGADEKKYLPLPSLPANEKSHNFDINSSDFYKELREIVKKEKKAVNGEKKVKDANFIIVSFESDLENIDMAQKLVEKRREWGADDLVIFVRIQKAHNDHFIFREKNVFFIGNESECTYNIERIKNDKIFNMAKMRNEVYDLEYKITHQKDFKPTEEAVLENKINANKNWHITKSQLERESSLYCCLSLQSKLNLMGLEYVEADANDVKGMTEDTYINYYAAGDMPDVDSYKLTVDGKKVVNYTLNFPESKRKNLAILEHYRWNSFMLSKGLVPASKEQILTETVEKNGKIRYTNGKNYYLRRHGNLTTFEGLVDFRKMIAERDGGDEAEYDVIKYDYQLLDDAFWLLDKNGYKIVKRKA